MGEFDLDSCFDIAMKAVNEAGEVWNNHYNFYELA